MLNLLPLVTSVKSLCKIELRTSVFLRLKCICEIYCHANARTKYGWKAKTWAEFSTLEVFASVPCTCSTVNQCSLTYSWKIWPKLLPSCLLVNFNHIVVLLDVLTLIPWARVTCLLIILPWLRHEHGSFLFFVSVFRFFRWARAAPQIGVVFSYEWVQ